ncbi:MAG: response regulator [Anaerolineae bacterium]|nr:response regulator [Gloeobacterales cyanobacterium ES-bin-313]
MRAKILVVDDDPSLLLLLSDLLQLQGYEIETAGSGYLALTMLKTMIPDLLISDVVMPGLDGYGLVEQLRNHPRFAQMPILFVSALCSGTDRQAGLSQGANAYLCKPFEPEVLISTAEKLLSHMPRPKFRAISPQESLIVESY